MLYSNDGEKRTESSFTTVSIFLKFCSGSKLTTTISSENGVQQFRSSIPS